VLDVDVILLCDFGLDVTVSGLSAAAAEKHHLLITGLFAVSLLVL
jgi:hypothetical protein